MKLQTRKSSFTIHGFHNWMNILASELQTFPDIDFTSTAGCSPTPSSWTTANVSSSSSTSLTRTSSRQFMCHYTNLTQEISLPARIKDDEVGVYEQDKSVIQEAVACIF